MNDTLQIRLDRILAYLKINRSTFEKNIGIGNGAAAKLTENSRPGTFDRISNLYPQINIAWLRTGVGSMLNSEAASSSIIGGDYSANALGAGASASVSDVVTLRSVSVLENQLKEKDEQISRLLSLLEKISITKYYNYENGNKG